MPADRAGTVNKTLVDQLLKDWNQTLLPLYGLLGSTRSGQEAREGFASYPNIG